MQKKAPTLSAAADTSGRGALRARLTVALATVGALLAAPAMAAGTNDGAPELRYTAAQMRAARADERAKLKADYVNHFGIPNISDALYGRLLEMDSAKRSACHVMLKINRGESTPSCQ